MTLQMVFHVTNLFYLKHHILMVYFVLLIIIQSYKALPNVPSTTPILQIFTNNGQRRNAYLPFLHYLTLPSICLCVEMKQIKFKDFDFDVPCPKYCGMPYISQLV